MVHLQPQALTANAKSLNCIPSKHYSSKLGNPQTLNPKPYLVDQLLLQLLERPLHRLQGLPGQGFGV